MKKILTWILALAMMFVLTACGCAKADENNTNPTEGEGHTHNYSSKETPATCTEKGSETFTCSCGDTYTDEIPATGHTWGEWEVESPALIGKDGTEKHTCSACSATETRETKEDAASNSFADDELQFLFNCWNGENGDITASGLLSYFAQKYEEREEEPLIVPAATVFEWLSARFVLTDALQAEMKQIEGNAWQYNAETDAFELIIDSSYGEMELLGYVQKEDNKYAVYYQFSSWEGTSRHDGIWEVIVEYNLLDGHPNKYLSATMVKKVPDKVINS